MLPDLRPENAEVAAEMVRDAGFHVCAATDDVASPESAHALVETATALGDVTESTAPYFYGELAPRELTPSTDLWLRNRRFSGMTPPLEIQNAQRRRRTPLGAIRQLEPDRVEIKSMH